MRKREKYYLSLDQKRETRRQTIGSLLLLLLILALATIFGVVYFHTRGDAAK